MWNYARIAAVIALAAALPAPAVHAQTPQPAEKDADVSASVTDEKLDKAAAAMERVAALKQAYVERLEEAQEDERPEIANEAQGALTNAVTEQGLSLEEYSNILVVAQNDANVREKILQRLRSTAKQRL